MRILGVDFTCAPRRAKPITVASGSLSRDRLHIEHVDRLAGLDAFEAMLRTPGPWVGGFDFPFGLPRELVSALGWPTTWPALVRHFAKLDRATIVADFATFRAARAAGSRYAHRAGDAASGAHPAMKLVNPPVALMMRAGAPRLLAAGVHIPGLHRGDRSRVALEAYPGLVMRAIAAASGRARAPSYKNDTPAKQTQAHREARVALLGGLMQGSGRFAIRTSMERGLAQAAIDDKTGDTLDAIAAAVQAAWGALRATDNHGVPGSVDPLEGWIVGSGLLDHAAPASAPQPVMQSV